MATQFLDDVIQGHQVIQSLDVTDLPAGEHKFWFRIATNALSQWQHLPVLVFKGDKPGKKIMITAGVHGDEYNGVLAAQKTARELIGKELAGTVTVVPTINLTGMLNHSRDFYSADPDASPANLNRFSQATQTAMRPIATCLHYGTICLSQMQSLRLICTPKPVVPLTHCMCLPISVSNNRWKWLAQLTQTLS